MPVAVIQNATSTSQRTLSTTLGAAAAPIAQKGLGSRSIVVVGEVVTHASATARKLPSDGPSLTARSALLA